MPTITTRKPPLAERQDSTKLSWLGEGADGFRGKDLALVVDEKRKLVLIILEQDLAKRDKQLAGKEFIAEVKTECNTERVSVDNVRCQGIDHDGRAFSAELLSSKDYDAVFWTESSIEKFLYPYYHAQRLWSPQMDDLKRTFEADNNAVAIAHRAPSTSSSLRVPSIDVGITDGEKGFEWKNAKAYIALRTT
jgi:hypothetical protein